ncbi:MAG: peptidyl-prolyl cis-trans isomerase [Lachnospiraceae bacterium]|nr:peptidyl-prolyl cis-trans isomerase [Lachnospiraceae bacterium]
MKKMKAAAMGLSLCLTGSLLLSGCSAKATDQLISIDNGKDSISYGYGNFVAHYNQAMYDLMLASYYGTSSDYWTQKDSSGKTYEDKTKDQVLESMEEQYLCKKHAGEYKVELSDADWKKIEKAAKKFLSDNNKQAIRQMGATEEYLKTMLEYETYMTRVKNKIKSAAKVEVTEEESAQSTVSYVKFSTAAKSDTSTGQQTVLTDNEKKALKKSAENVAAASDFKKAVKEEKGEVQTASFTSSADASESQTLPADVVKAAQDLSDGQISKVIEVKDDGYYVVRMDAVYDKKATKDKEKELKEQKQEEAYTKVVDGWKKGFSWKVDKKLWKQVNFEDRFAAKESAKNDNK